MPDRQRATLLFATGLAAIAGFAAIARAVARRDTAPVDRDVHAKTAVDPDHPARRAAGKVAPIGKWWTYVPAAALAGGYVFVARRRVAGTAAIIATSIVAAALNETFDDLLPQPPAPPGRPTPDHPVFPSGHAFGTTAVALAAAYVLSRERAAHPLVVFPIAAAIPLLSSAGRLIEEKHWISDILAGHLGAVGVAGVMLGVYEGVW